MKKSTYIFILTTVAIVIFGVSGCEQKPQQTVSQVANSSQRAATAVPGDLFVKEAPGGARGVAEVKADASAAGEVVVRGRIGGRKAPFVDGAAVFVLADTSMKACNELHGDSCKTPWDYCCEPRASLAAKTATIQVIGADGKPLRADLQGKHGLAPLMELIVAGEIAQREEGGPLVINARRIYVEPSDG